MCAANTAIKIRKKIINFFFFLIIQNENIWQILILLQGFPFYACFTNQKTFTLILTWLNNETSGNGMAERQQHGKHLIALCVAPWKHLTWVELLLQITSITCWLSFPQHGRVNCTHQPFWTPHTTHTEKAFRVSDLSWPRSAKHTALPSPAF